jgi:hypothetical protein
VRIIAHRCASVRIIAHRCASVPSPAQSNGNGNGNPHRAPLRLAWVRPGCAPPCCAVARPLVAPRCPATRAPHRAAAHRHPGVPDAPRGGVRYRGPALTTRAVFAIIGLDITLLCDVLPVVRRARCGIDIDAALV